MEELAQVAPHRLGVGGVRRAQIDEQHADRAAGHLRMIGGPVAEAGPGKEISFIEAF